MVRDFRQTISINPLRTCGDVIDDRICVCVRKRPLSKKGSVGSALFPQIIRLIIALQCRDNKKRNRYYYNS